MIIPSDYQRLKSLPEDPEGSVTYGKQTDNAACIVTLYSIAPEEAMDFTDKQKLITGIHNTLADNQAVIEVEAGKLASGRPFIYSIIKTKTNEGVQYFMLLHFETSNLTCAVRAFFMEQGITGVRDASVYELYRRNNPNFSNEQWFYDPYNPTYPGKFKMNISEQEQYDELFPNHPLSQCRLLIRHYKENF